MVVVVAMDVAIMLRVVGGSGGFRAVRGFLREEEYYYRVRVWVGLLWL